MAQGFMPFFVVLLLIFTYFWVNPLALATFMEGLIRYLVEIYLGYKEWRIEYEAKKAYRRYLRQSRRLARESGFSDHLVRLYFKTYGEDDWRTFKTQSRQAHEERYRDLEDSMRELIF